MQATVTIDPTGGTTTGIRATGIVGELDAGKRPRVRVTFPNGHVLRVRVGSHDDDAFIPVSAATRGAAGVAAGDRVAVTVEVDDDPVVIGVPDDLLAALAREPAARECFEGLTASQKKGFTTSVTSAKKPETRQRRIENAVTALTAGRKRP